MEEQTIEVYLKGIEQSIDLLTFVIGFFGLVLCILFACILAKLKK